MSALAAGHLVKAHMIHNRGGGNKDTKKAATSPKDSEEILLKGSLYGSESIVKK